MAHPTHKVPTLPLWGHLKVSRKAFSKLSYWDEDRIFSRWEAFIDLLQGAAWGDTTVTISGLVYAVKRGEFMVSYTYLSKRWQWSQKKVRLFVAELIRDERIEVVTATNGRSPTRYCWINYAAYQSQAAVEDRLDDKGTPQDTPRGTPVPSAHAALEMVPGVVGGTAKGTNTKDKKKDKKNKHSGGESDCCGEHAKDITVSEPETADMVRKLLPERKRGCKDPYPSEFETAWEAYPGKDVYSSKVAAYREYRSTRITYAGEFTATDLLRATQHYWREREEAGEEYQQYVKGAQTFFGPDEHWRNYLHRRPEHQAEKKEGTIGDVIDELMRSSRQTTSPASSP